MRCLKQHFGNVDTYRRRSCCRQHRIHQSVDGNRLSFPYQYHGINSLDRNIFLLSYPGFDIRIAGLVPIAKVIFVDCHNPGSFTTGRQCWYSILAVSKRGEYSCCKWVGVNSRFDTISDVMLAFILLSLFAQIRQYRTSWSCSSRFAWGIFSKLSSIHKTQDRSFLTPLSLDVRRSQRYCSQLELMWMHQTKRVRAQQQLRLFYATVNYCVMIMINHFL